jgi:hypothetical protein
MRDRLLGSRGSQTSEVLKTSEVSPRLLSGPRPAAFLAPPYVQAVKPLLLPLAVSVAQIGGPVQSNENVTEARLFFQMIMLPGCPLLSGSHEV